jgi:phosphatidylserine/phosphatidylglycerophosphate/cardiolipin synthase-like enzyme
VVKKYKVLTAAILLAALYAFLIRAALNPSLPSPKAPLIFYSNQQRDDFRLVLQKVFSDARHSIDITMYAVTDAELLKKLYLKAAEGLSVKIRHDRSSATPIYPPLIAIPIKAKGLMHRKIVITDDAYVFLGSANMTTSSLVLHDNLSVGFYHPSLARFLKEPCTPYFDFTVEEQPCRLWLLPDLQALDYLIEQISQAQSSIFVAMFTLTHPQLLEALSDAHKRGIDIVVALDHYAARGASRKAVQFLQSQNIRVVFSQGLQLLHHKWAYIDKSQIVLGSTNWTKAAFAKNQDCLLFIRSLTHPQQKLLDRLSSMIALESNDTL